MQENPPHEEIKSLERRVPEGALHVADVSLMLMGAEPKKPEKFPVFAVHDTKNGRWVAVVERGDRRLDITIGGYVGLGNSAEAAAEALRSNLRSEDIHEWTVVGQA